MAVGSMLLPGLSPSQQGIWPPRVQVSVQLSPGDVARIEFALRTVDFEGHLDGRDEALGALRKCFADLLEQHDIIGLE